MKTALMILAGLLLSTIVAHAQPNVRPGTPPTFKIVSNVNKAKGLLIFRETVYKNVPVQKQIVVMENGQAVTKTVTEYVTIAEERINEINVTNGRVITPDGKQLPIDEVWNRVKTNTVVVVSADGNAPSEAYLRALSAEALIIIPGLPKTQ